MHTICKWDVPLRPRLGHSLLALALGLKWLRGAPVISEAFRDYHQEFRTLHICEYGGRQELCADPTYEVVEANDFTTRITLS